MPFTCGNVLRSIATALGQVTLSLLVCSALACSAPAARDEAETTASTASPILDGTVEPTDSGVIGVLDLDLHTLCSGVLVSDRAVITARHCVAPVGPDESTVDCGKTSFGQESSPTRVVVTTSKGGANPTLQHAVARVIVPDDPGFCGGDLAVLVLAQPLSTSEAIPIPMRLDHRVGAGETFAAIGIGRTDKDPSGTRRRRDGLHVQCVGGDCDSPLVDGKEWWGDGAVCEGDSGGPALDGEGRVVGIASRKRAGCTATIYTDVAGNSVFLGTALGLAVTTPTQPDVVKCSYGHSPASPFVGVIALAGALCALRRRR